jgi:exodeoxyribonuclease III
LKMDGFDAFWNPAEKKGYSGTGILSRIPFVDVSYGLGIEELDTEGRVVTAETGDFYLVTVYTPNSQRGLARLEYRTRVWDAAFREYLIRLDEKKPVIFCGDLNVAHEEIDLANPKSNKKNAGFTPEERQSFTQLLDSGFVDSFRAFCKEGGHYTWWSNFGKSRERNIGWRIDYFGVSERLRAQMRSASIHPNIFGSDHCPISLEIA